MNVVLTIVLTVQMLSALAMIGLILIQHGKGADMGAAFGSGSSGSLFGASGSANFLSRTTAVLATVFFVCTLALAYFGNLRPVSSGSVLERAGVNTSAPAPVAPDSGVAAQIPADAAPAAAVQPPAPVASGAAQIPTR
jgi:preprotein translocase subunit SecG